MLQNRLSALRQPVLGVDKLQSVMMAISKAFRAEIKASIERAKWTADDVTRYKKAIRIRSKAMNHEDLVKQARSVSESADKVSAQVEKTLQKIDKVEKQIKTLNNHLFHRGLMFGAIATTVIYVVLALLVNSANAQEVSSIRDSQYEWRCETADGAFISGHTRQDKAFQSCFNQAFATGNNHIVRGGTYRVTVTGATTPPTEPAPDPAPDPEPQPEPEPAPDDSFISFGPVTSIVSFPASIATLKPVNIALLSRHGTYLTSPGTRTPSARKSGE